MKISKGSKIEEINLIDFSELVKKFKKVVVDIGTGSGRFVYESAKLNPQNFYIGIDPNQSGFEKYASKIYKKESKGGLKNCMFVVASIEHLPRELSKIADEIFVINPWGTLLSYTVNADKDALTALKKLSKKNTKITMYFNYSSKYEPQSMKQFNVVDMSEEFIEGKFKKHYKQFEFHLLSYQKLSNLDFENISATWSKRLSEKRERIVWEIVLSENKNLLNELEDRKEVEKKSEKKNTEQNDNVLSYTFEAFGHENILATHTKTLEITKDLDLTLNGDCIIGINSNFKLNELQKFREWVDVELTCENESENFRCFINPQFESDHEIVFRKSKFGSERTFGILCTKSSFNINRNIIKNLKNPTSVLKIKVTQRVKKVHKNKYKQD